MKKNVSTCILAVAVAGLLGGCATWNSWFPRKAEPAAPAASPAAAPGAAQPPAAAGREQAAAAPAAVAAPRTGEMTVAEAQTQLNALGFDCGKADGVLGKKPRSQLKRFQKSKGLAVSGKLDDATIAALRAR